MLASNVAQNRNNSCFVCWKIFSDNFPKATNVAINVAPKLVDLSNLHKRGNICCRNILCVFLEYNTAKQKCSSTIYLPDDNGPQRNPLYTVINLVIVVGISVHITRARPGNITIVIFVYYTVCSIMYI